VSHPLPNPLPGEREQSLDTVSRSARLLEYSGFPTLLYKEVLRFWKVSFQTVAAPVLTTLLYLLVFAHALAGHVQAFPGVAYLQFLVPGLAMMAMLQNSFANSSSSLIQSKITGNIVFILLPPLGPGEIFAAYLIASMVRGMVVGLGVFAATLWLVPLPLAHPLWALAFAVAGCGMLGTMGIIAGIWSEKFDQLAAFQNFLVMPLTFLAGVFFLLDALAAALLAGGVEAESVLLRDRRLPLRILRPVGRGSVAQPRDCERRVRCPIMAHSAPAPQGLQAQALNAMPISRRGLQRPLPFPPGRGLGRG
jgi:ABC-2 type transport system permease protein